ncbi:Protein of unknown function [Escherichia coli D6-113.11]|nr:Protein of unknown function [Escherichia coli D6-113.11]CDU33408.1 Protein of unknown function [Escherichia coli D6-113.11]
MSFTNAVL